nr:MAG TPA: hypothetical protein [Caudoviricetes sp.]DAS75804.1 MAG TPA: hypothetical protein [Caudoviricetes sp.]
MRPHARSPRDRFVEITIPLPNFVVYFQYQHLQKYISLMYLFANVGRLVCSKYVTYGISVTLCMLLATCYYLRGKNYDV